MFNAHVGAVNVYIYDSDGKYVISREESLDDGDGLDKYDYVMHFDLPVGKYRVVAVGLQRSTAVLATQPGAKFRLPAIPAEGAVIDDFNVRLDHDTNTGEVYNSQCHLDTLWMGNIDTPIEVKQWEVTKAQVPLVRNTKRILVSLHNLDEPRLISLDDYQVDITADNGLTLYDNSHPSDMLLTYTPHAQWGTDWSDDATTTDPSLANGSEAVHYELSTGRLLYENSNRDARLYIRRTSDGTVIADLNLPAILQQGRGAYETEHYTAQEYLDREYSYYLDFFIKGSTWLYATLSIKELAWTKRMQNVEL
jgi:hypothetical protein